MLVYLNSLHGEMVYDDFPAIRDNPDVDASKTTIRDVFLDNFWGRRMGAPDAIHEVEMENDRSSYIIK